MKITKRQLKQIIKEELNEVFGFGNKAKRRKEIQKLIDDPKNNYHVRAFLLKLMQALKSTDVLPDELEDLADLTNQDLKTQRQQLKTVIRQGGALQSFANSLPGDYDDTISLIQNIVQEAPDLFIALMDEAAAKVGPMASPEQRLARSHR